MKVFGGFNAEIAVLFGVFLNIQFQLFRNIACIECTCNVGIFGKECQDGCVNVVIYQYDRAFCAVDQV